MYKEEKIKLNNLYNNDIVAIIINASSSLRSKCFRTKELFPILAARWARAIGSKEGVGDGRKLFIRTGTLAT